MHRNVWSKCFRALRVLVQVCILRFNARAGDTFRVIWLAGGQVISFKFFLGYGAVMQWLWLPVNNHSYVVNQLSTPRVQTQNIDT